MFAAVAFLLIGFFCWVAVAETQQSVSGSFQTTPGGNTNSPCPGLYKGYARMTNSTGIWFRPPTNTTLGIFTNSATFSIPPNLQVMRRSDGMLWCGTNTVTFPASSSNQYQLGAFLKTNAPPPTNGQVVTLTVQWQ